MVEQVIKAPISIDDLMRMDAECWTEVVDGEWVEAVMSPSYQHVILLRQLMRILDPYVEQHKLGQVFPDGLMYVLHVDTELGVRYARIPDLSFIRQDEIPADLDITKPFPGAPTLAVEIVSPNEKRSETLAKISDYLNYGTTQTWVIYPLPRQIEVYTQDAEHPTNVYGLDDAIPTDELFPGLTLTVADIFAGIKED